KYTVPSIEEHKKQTTSQVYVKCKSVHDLVWDKERVDVPRYVVCVYDIETSTKSAKVEDPKEEELKQQNNNKQLPTNKNAKKRKLEQSASNALTAFLSSPVKKQNFNNYSSPLKNNEQNFNNYSSPLKNNEQNFNSSKLENNNQQLQNNQQFE